VSFVLVSLGGAVGAVLRYWVTGGVTRRVNGTFPVGTLAVNLAGAFALGLLVGGAEPDSMTTLTLAGLLSGFTTFSTWILELVGGAQAGDRTQAWINLGVSLVGGVALAALGYSLTG
jgi:fluoride exporter